MLTRMHPQVRWLSLDLGTSRTSVVGPAIPRLDIRARPRSAPTWRNLLPEELAFDCRRSCPRKPVPGGKLRFQINSRTGGRNLWDKFTCALCGEAGGSWRYFMIIVLTSIRTVCGRRRVGRTVDKSRPRGPGLKGKRWRSSGRLARSEISFCFVARSCQRACAPCLPDRPELVDGLASGVAEAGSGRRLTIRAPKQDRERGMASAATGILPLLAVP